MILTSGPGDHGRSRGERVFEEIVRHDWSVVAGSFLLALAVLVFLSSTADTEGMKEGGPGVAFSGEFPSFSEVSERAGLVHGEQSQFGGTPGYNGVYVTDFNRDGYEDVLTVNGNGARLFENREGTFDVVGGFEQFSNVISAHFFDYDNSGYEDVILLRRNLPPVFLKNHGGVFSIEDVGIDETFTLPYDALTGDFNQDNCLDLFIVQWGGPENYAGREIYENHPEVRPGMDVGRYPNRFYRGNCDTFTEATEDVGLGEGTFPTFTGSFLDFTGDGLPDIHTANDFSRDMLYINTGNGTFRGRDMGPSSDRNAMSSHVADVNGDYLPDIFVTNVWYPKDFADENRDRLLYANVPLPEGNNLFINGGNGTFTDRATEYGVHAGGWGWSSAIADFSNDGRQSILHANSYASRPVESPGKYRTMRIFVRNDSGRYTQVDARERGFSPENSRGLARIDYDADGDLDLLMTTYPHRSATSRKGDYLLLYENAANGTRYLQLMLDGDGYVTTGTEFYLETNESVQYRVLDSGSDFMSQDSSLVHFGLGTASVESLRMVFPDGGEMRFEDIHPNNRYVILREDARLHRLER